MLNAQRCWYHCHADRCITAAVLQPFLSGLAPITPALQVNTLDSGEIDYDDLRARLTANCSRPAIINVNIGTTVKGAVDDLDRVLDILQETGYTEDR